VRWRVFAGVHIKVGRARYNKGLNCVLVSRSAEHRRENKEGRAQNLGLAKQNSLTENPPGRVPEESSGLQPTLP
jgi:hypothetical protein